MCSNSRNGFGHDHDDIFVSLAELSVPDTLPPAISPSVEEDLPGVYLRAPKPPAQTADSHRRRNFIDRFGRATTMTL